MKGDKLNKDLNLSKNTNERKDLKILENFDKADGRMKKGSLKRFSIQASPKDDLSNINIYMSNTSN